MPSISLPSATLLSAEQAAAYLGITVGTLKKWRVARRPGLRCFKVGRKAMYDPIDLDKFMRSRPIGSPADEEDCPKSSQRKPTATHGKARRQF